jgi:VanZ family protein
MRFSRHRNRSDLNAASRAVNPQLSKAWFARAISWAPVVIWMTVMFNFSTDAFSSAHTTPYLAKLFPRLPAVHIEILMLAIRKLGHWSEYFILALLLMRALNREFAGYSAMRRIIWSVVLAVLYAISDELHQSFVPSRDARALDVLIDAIGAICGTLASYLVNRRTGAGVKMSVNPGSGNCRRGEKT